MTKERKVAVRLWKRIAKEIEEGKLTTHTAKAARKAEFLRNRRIRWVARCWFCHYMRCSKCPLARSAGGGRHECSEEGSVYRTAMDDNNTERSRARSAAAARAIAEALRTGVLPAGWKEEAEA